MNIGMIGLGKLGLPVCVAMDLKGHRVMGYDVDSARMTTSDYPHRETGPDGKEAFAPYLERSGVMFGTMADVVAHSDIMFVSVQTPHDPQFEGVTRLPDERKDFDYSYLVNAMIDLNAEIMRQQQPKIVVIISTVLPGTIDKRIRYILSPLVKLAYNPFFIAMGSVMRDFLHPEFVLLGIDDREAAEQVKAFYATITDAPVYATAIINAEAIKVAYNTFISTKIALVNTWMEIAHKTGADVDEITNALKMATTRLISGQYLSGGMGDGGGCHPRDNIALSWLARELDLSYDFFEAIMYAREMQTEWLADLVEQAQIETGMRVIIMGYAFKAETNLTTGSPARLLAKILNERDVDYRMYDPYIVDGPAPLDKPAVFFIGARHEQLKCYAYPAGSVIIDPWRYVEDKPGCRVIRVGQGARL